MKLRFSSHGWRAGFTLIELLLVIAIVGMLVTGAMYALNQGRMKSRDAKRIADLNTITKALELYFTDKGAYPPSLCAPNGLDCGGGGYIASNNATNWANLQTALSPYLATKLPVDPVNTPGCLPWENDKCYVYSYGNVGRVTYGNTYDLSARLETPNHPESCGQKVRYWYFDDRPWCTAFGGPYSNQMYEASPQ